MLPGVTPPMRSRSSRMGQKCTRSQFVTITNPRSCSHTSSALQMMQMQSVKNESQTFIIKATDSGVSQMKSTPYRATTTRTGEVGSNMTGDCRRCKKQSERDNLTVEVHEWPLPESVYDAAVVVFELASPVAFKMWRSFTFHFLTTIYAPQLHNTPKVRGSTSCSHIMRRSRVITQSIPVNVLHWPP
ncbi:hypothetical protein EV424DRAFT_171977 [Suillus variegatus]|nr:hypothetical protein EV424DRAFT_171977 [Suillus variegatus]